MAKHSEKSSLKFFLYIIIIILLCVITFAIIKFIIPKFNTNLDNTTNNDNNIVKANNTETEILEVQPQDISSKHAFKNSSHLNCENFSLTVENDITTINGTILNDSDDIISELLCSFELKDKNNVTIYEFDITINNILAHDSSAFAYMALLDLSNVNNYIVSIKN